MADPPLPSRVLVTGGNGFVGRHLVAALAARGEVEAVAVGTHGGGDPMPAIDKARCIPLDVTDADEVNAVVADTRPTHVVHLAAIAAVPSAQRNVQRTWAINCGGALNVALAIAARAPSCRLVYCSSAEVYGGSFRSGQPLDESALLDPTTCYGASKAAADLMIGQMAREGLRAIRIRPFNHTGHGQSEDFVVPAFAAQIARIERGQQEPVIRVGNLESRRDLLDVRDVVDAYVRACRRFDDLPPGCVLNVAAGRAPRIQEFLDILISLARVPIHVQQDPARLRPIDTPVVLGNAARARQLLDWTPTHDLPATLASVLDYYRAR